MSNVDESLDESESSSEDPIVLNEDEDQHDPFEFPNGDNIFFSRSMSYSMIR
jgi:hypothetical protein